MFTLSYNFKNPDLLSKALTHRSYLNEAKVSESNERLEFLGDAVLELIISEYLFHQHPDQPEGQLTAARSAIVRTETLARLATELKLGEALNMSRGEEKSGGRANISLLANTTEAVIGAIFLDGGLTAAKDFVATHLFPIAAKILQGDLKDAKSLLQEKVQELGFNSPSYATLSEEGPDHNKIFTVAVSVSGKQLATGEGKNKQAAQQDAAQNALPIYQKLLAKPS